MVRKTALRNGAVFASPDVKESGYRIARRAPIGGKSENPGQQRRHVMDRKQGHADHEQPHQERADVRPRGAPQPSPIAPHHQDSAMLRG
ncbi:MAG TPA: hypothetical protein VKV22_06225 [Rhodanobacteraceae bacterium]|nr:hypothetical protein [Rhodanobacteraceae bacterium]